MATFVLDSLKPFEITLGFALETVEDARREKSPKISAINFFNGTTLRFDLFH